MATVIPPRTYAQEHKKLTILLGYTGPLQGIPADVLNEGIEASCRVTRDGTRFSATESDTDTTDAALCEEGTPETLGGSNFEGNIEPFRFFNEENPGVGDEEADEIFQALKHKGTEVTFVERHTGKRFDEDWESGDEYSAFRGTVDNWQRQQTMEGYIKTPIPVREIRAELNGEVAASGGTGGDSGA
ncbi:hypothetical protein ACFP47_10155 [Nesterenkonia lacusekhoensis]|uniref:Phage tail protein n=1 Tax=Nesterenkonia lacusekhoensis TaxID=150832 RepID=A0ABS4T517_9MICC|nr:hypothetical protein [Nesterenkonia lacusekhoensis]MBP2319563.1 hypothetical protein [Nesterenkonia lacusekhoensis]